MVLEVKNKCSWLKFVLSCKTWKGQGVDEQNVSVPLRRENLGCVCGLLFIYFPVKKKKDKGVKTQLLLELYWKWSIQIRGSLSLCMKRNMKNKPQTL